VERGYLSMDFKETFLMQWSASLKIISTTLILTGLAILPASVCGQDGKVPPIGRPQQPGDDVAREFEPLKKPTEADARRSDAKAWYMAGKLKQTSGDSEAAYEAYQKAIAIDPEAVEVYRAMVPLAFELKKPNEGIRFAQKVVELDPSDYKTLRQLGEISFRTQRIPLALKYFEQAVQSKDLDKRGPFYVLLCRDLAVLYGVNGQIEKSADNFAVLYDARTNPKKFDLEFQLRRLLDRDAAVSFERIGDALLLANRHEVARQAYEKLAEELKGKPGAHNYSLARVYMATDKLPRAETELQKYFDARLNSKGREPYSLLADILDKTNRKDELIPKLEAIREKDKRNSSLLFYLANAYLDADRTDDAEELYIKTLNGPGAGDSAGYLGLAAVHRRTNKSRELIDTLVSAFKTDMKIESLNGELEAIVKDKKVLDSAISTGEELIKEDIPQLTVEGAYILGRLASDAERTESAYTFYKFALQGKPTAPVAQAIYLDYGGMLMNEDKFEESAAMFEQAAQDPRLRDRQAAMLLFQSQALEFAGQTEKAVEVILNAQRIAPEAGQLRYQEGWIYYHARQWDKAIPIFEQVMQNFAGDKDTLRQCQFSLSNILVERGELDKGEKILEDVLAEDPDDPSVNNDLGYLYADQGKHLEKAEKMIRLAIEAEPENAAYQDSMGWVLFRLGRYGEARTHLEKATKLLNGTDSTIMEHLGDCLEKLELNDEAIKSWKSALEHEQMESAPDNELVDRLKSKIEKAN
jgi:tetratricopeptide (TPR) repeat protein